MDSFGEILRKQIEESGYNIYQFAKVSGINRINLQRYIANQRFPAEDVFQTILNHLQLQSDEQDLLKTAYTIEQMGKPLYFQRLFIKNLMESFSVIYEDERQRTAFAENSYSLHHFASPADQDKIQLIHGGLSVLQLFRSELIRTMQTQDSPFAYLFLPTEQSHAFTTHALTAIQRSDKHVFQITQIFPLTKMAVSTQDTGNHNLKVLSAMLPLCFSLHFHYQPYYYYDNHVSDQNPGIMYPYYAILNDSLLLFSHTLEDAVLCMEQKLIDQYRRMFEEHLAVCRSFIHSTSAYDNILVNYFDMNQPAQHGKEYSLIYHPCLTSVANAEIADALLRDDIEGRDTLLPLIVWRIEQIQKLSGIFHHYFSEQGLIDFIKTGTCVEFPASLVKVIPPKYRLLLIKNMREVCESDHQCLRITNPLTFKVPEYLSLNVTEPKTIFSNSMRNTSWNMVTITEASIHLTLMDFMDYLPSSPYLYSKEQTLEILDKHINVLERRMTLSTDNLP